MVSQLTYITMYIYISHAGNYIIKLSIFIILDVYIRVEIFQGTLSTSGSVGLETCRINLATIILIQVISIFEFLHEVS